MSPVVVKESTQMLVLSVFKKETKVMVRLVLSFVQDMVVQLQITMKMIAIASTSKPCRYCGRSWSHGHHCQEYADYKRKLHVDPKNPRDSDKSIYAIVRTANEENDHDHDMTEAENHSYDCKAL
ncbi:hypothetical protein G6F37_013958 [Rhizopus arrhizus]|nr:hypothetical protein G6F37_013958 [Rhizopus arrhizus]